MSAGGESFVAATAFGMKEVGRMITISLCMIVKNEQEVLSRCLESVKGVFDELVIVDTGSTDRTKEIALAYTDKVHDFQWVDDFSAARNHSFGLATKEYIMWLDADDVLLEEDRTELVRLKETLSAPIDAAMMRYDYGFDGAGNVTLSFYRERLVRRDRNFVWQEPVHEHIKTSGHIETYQISVTHRREHGKSGRNLEIYQKMEAEGKKFSPRGLFYFGKELYENEQYSQAVDYFNRFLDCSDGWVEDQIQSCYLLSICRQKMHDSGKAIKDLIRSFEYATPRAEICCRLGWHYLQARDFKKAIFWYDLATRLERPGGWGFILHDLWGFTPWIQLCVCYDKIGDIDRAIACNERAAEFKPDHSNVAHNRRYFQLLKCRDNAPGAAVIASA